MGHIVIDYFVISGGVPQPSRRLPWRRLQRTVILAAMGAALIASMMMVHGSLSVAQAPTALNSSESVIASIASPPDAPVTMVALPGDRAPLDECLSVCVPEAAIAVACLLFAAVAFAFWMAPRTVWGAFARLAHASGVSFDPVRRDSRTSQRILRSVDIQ